MLRRIISVTLLVAFIAWTAWYVTGNADAFLPLLQVTWLDVVFLTLAFLAIMIGNGLFIAIIAQPFRIHLKRLEWLSLSFASSFYILTSD